VRIEELVLERYGFFTDRKLSFHPEAALHVVLGANEAGKTSALSAIGDLLFGFGARTDHDFRHDARMLRIGGTFRHSDGRAVAARRRKGTKNTLLDPDDQPLADDPFGALLGGVSRIAFNREFGMTARALREGGDELLSAGGRLAETLAASSAGMAELSRVKDRLQEQASELFTARRSGSKLFYLACDRRDDADKALRDAVVTRDALQQLNKAADEAEAHLAALSAAHAASGATLACWQRTLRVRADLSRMESIDAERAALAGLPAVAGPVLSEWRSALDLHGTLEAEIAALDAAVAAEVAEIDAMTVDAPLLADGPAIEGLRERLGAVRKAIDDLPRRRQARDAAEATLDDSARRLGLSSSAELLERLPSDPALAAARDLVAQLRRATEDLAAIDAAHDRARKELAEFAVEDHEAQLVSDIAPVRQRFEALGDIPGQEERLHRDRAALAVERASLDDAVAALDPSPGALGGLRALPLPDRATIATYANVTELAGSDMKRLDQSIATIDGNIAATEAELARLTGPGAMPTRIDLGAARANRDARFDDLRGGLGADRGLRAAQVEEALRASQRIDDITDRLLTGAERATRLEDAQRRVADCRKERDLEIVRRDNLQRRLDELRAQWTEAWRASGLSPHGAVEMQRWRDRFDDIVTRLDKSDLQRVQIDAQAAGLDSGKQAAVTFLASVGRKPDQALPAGVLYREAKARVDQLIAAWSDAKVRAATRRRLERDVSEAGDAREKMQIRIESLQQQWSPTMTAIGRSGDATPADAEAALAVWNSVGVPKASFEREGRIVATIASDLTAFERDVADLLNRVAPDLCDLAAQDGLSHIAERLAVARHLHEARERLRAGVAKRLATRATFGGRLTVAIAALDDACRIIGVADVAALPEPIGLLSARHALESERASLQRHLHDIADGHDEGALRAEREGLDLDQLPAGIEREKLRQEQLLRDIAAASALHHQQRRELETLAKGRNAAAAAARRAEAGAEIVSIAEDWLLKSAAAQLARRAIDLHRSKVQDPMIARASDLFAMATAGAFAGLGIDYGDEDQPVLVARRPGGERVQVSGLSEGTRDQLFLALRLALLERRTSEPMPFIGDDLLASFDEKRTLATLRLLAAAGRERQMIVFTHHRHVSDLARSLAEHHVDVIDL
jgi:chromosome segregation protein